ncbi:MAG: pyridoxamine 5'-phosphate oxidase family protein [Anaerolineales bacterium]|nr:pyridoxamine 5'-phosphate oxidase family protein [Anaerolineales bacterium]
MRRKDKEIMDRKDLDHIIHNSTICHLACSRDNKPYLVPLSFGYDGKSVYFHTAPSGLKIETITKNPQVCLAFESEIRLITNPDQACRWSFEYTSVIASGEIIEITDLQEKNTALNQIMVHYSGQSWDFPVNELSNTRIWRVPLETISGKHSPH